SNTSPWWFCSRLGNYFISYHYVWHTNVLRQLMNNLLEKMRKAREISIAVGDYIFLITRPTDIDAVSMSFDDLKAGVVGVSSFVIGWEGVTELDLIPGGTADSVEFDADLFSEWIKDRPDLWQPLIDGVLDAYKSHRKRQEAQGKP
ncbi:MAG: hypothetical protein GY750_13800, partial [Lentisphaerae bacterium]|nr:hypothetical protein [Lentisphaerota bacterium]